MDVNKLGRCSVVGGVSIAVCQLLILVALPMATAPRVFAQDAANRDDERKKPFSPLHNFLGIDPETGKFVEPKTAPAAPSQERRPQENQVSAEKTSDGSTASSAGSRRTVQENLPQDAEEAAEAVRRVAERINEGSLDDLSSLLDERLSSDRLKGFSRRFAWITGGLLLLYPLSMVISELLGWWFRRNEAGLTDLDRRYQQTRLRRRLLLASTLMGLIVIVTIGSVNAYWWNQPERFTLFCIAVGVLGIAAATLSSMLKQATKQYSMTLMREMRREQLEMRAELDELCKRLRQVTMTSD